jgi:phenylacetate-coenzyme A ligase PaaK-like adenylate-forming protein
MENWIAGKIAGEGRSITSDDICRYQLSGLRGTIEYVAEKSPFYRRMFQDFSVNDLHDLDDFARLPFTTLEDIRDSGPQFVCVSQSEIERVVTLAMPDRTTQPRRLYFTGEDLEPTIDFYRHGMSTLVEAGQKALILMPGERPGSVGDLLTRGLSRLAVEGIAHGFVEDLSKTIRVIMERKIDCIVGLPTDVLTLARHQDARRIPAGQIKGVLLSPDACRKSAYVPAIIVDELRRIWDCPVLTHYSTTEMGFGGGVECDACCGYHLREADLYFEIVDPDSGRPVPSGTLGEIVFTTLTRKGMPLVRYRTRDLAKFRPTPCPCGTVLRTLGKVQGRLHEMIRLRTGEWVGIADFDKAFSPISGMVGYTVTISPESGMDRMDISMAASHRGRVDPAALTAAALTVPAVRRAVEQRRLIVGKVYPISERYMTAGVVGKAIVRQSV